LDSRLKISGMTGEVASLLSVFVRNLNNGRRRPYGSKKKKHGCLIKDFGNDERGGVTPECIYHPVVSHSWMVLRGV